MAVIAILNSKGGSGKTTLAINLAGGLAAHGKNILLVDSDPQGSTTGWSFTREEQGITQPNVRSMPQPETLRTIDKEAYDHVIIDGSARLEELLTAALRIADAVLIPVRPSPLDLYASREVIELVWQEQKTRDRPLRYAVCVTQQIGGSILAREIGGAARELGVPLLEARMHHRLDYVRAAQLGMTVQEYQPLGKAAQETEQLVCELLNFVK